MCVREKHRGRWVGERLIEEFFAWAGARSERRSRRMRPMGARSTSTKGVGSGPERVAGEGDRVIPDPDSARSPAFTLAGTMVD